MTLKACFKYKVWKFAVLVSKFLEDLYENETVEKYVNKRTYYKLFA